MLSNMLAFDFDLKARVKRILHLQAHSSINFKITEDGEHFSEAKEMEKQWMKN